MDSCCTVNQSTMERFLRVLLGLGLLTLVTETQWGFLGFIPLFSGAIGFCPFYSFLGISTCCASGCNKEANQS